MKTSFIHADHCRGGREDIRSEGPEQVGVAKIMGKAGLTHGGFYAHFPSKNALVEASIAYMFEQALTRWNLETSGLSPEHGMAAYIDFYLSLAHRDQRATGCPIAALASDLPRLPTGCQKAFSAGVRNLAGAIGRHLEPMGFALPQAAALSVVNELVGALSLARCESNRARAAEILDASRTGLKARLGLKNMQA